MGIKGESILILLYHVACANLQMYNEKHTYYQLWLVLEGIRQ